MDGLLVPELFQLNGFQSDQHLLCFLVIIYEQRKFDRFCFLNSKINSCYPFTLAGHCYPNKLTEFCPGSNNRVLKLPVCMVCKPFSQVFFCINSHGSASIITSLTTILISELTAAKNILLSMIEIGVMFHYFMAYSQNNRVAIYICSCRKNI